MKYTKTLFLLLLIFLLNSVAYGLTFDSAKVLEKGQVSFAIASYLADGRIGTKTAYFGALLINEYGVMDSLNSVVRLGYCMEEEAVVYAGLEGKILLTERFGGTDVFTLNIGGHYKKNVGVDLVISAGNFFFKFDNYFGFDFDIDFVDDKIEYPGDFIFGAKLTPFSNKNNSIIIEGGIPVTSFSSYKIGLAYIMGF